MSAGSADGDDAPPAGEIDRIWKGDRLGRRREAAKVQQFLYDEVDELARQGREQSYVLAIDAPYGVGKSYFLERFRRQLALNHPVAHFDAWIDDANDEPLVAIMAAIETALQPYMGPGKKLGRKFKAATAAALPIIGKLVTGAGSTFAKRWMGEEIGDVIGEELTKTTAEAIEEASGEGIDAAKQEIETLIDREASQMLDAYKRRRQSRETFKASMRALIAGISSAEADVSTPLFIVIDELDRCRPDFAIRVLEEVKHFFDIPGVIFIIALHGEQLSKSIKAVYGAEFASEAYLRRFFSRKYMLRQPTLGALIRELFATSDLDDMAFAYPTGLDGRQISVHNFCANFLADYDATSREIIAVVDMVRVFKRTWKDDYQIQLPLLLGIIIHRIRDRYWRSSPIQGHDLAHTAHMSHMHVEGYTSNLTVQYFTNQNLMEAYGSLIHHPISDANPLHASNVAHRYVLDALHEEFTTIYDGQPRGRPNSILTRYADTIEEIVQFALPTDNEGEQD